MNRAASDYISDLILSGAQAQDDVLAARCFDMAEGAAGVLLLDESLPTPVHQQLALQIKATRAARLPGGLV